MKDFLKASVIVKVVFPFLLLSQVSHAQSNLSSLSAEWWQWALSIPSSANPLNDSDGSHCGVGQHGNTWFLAGSNIGEVTRVCTVKKGKDLFFPVINIECSNIEQPPFFGATLNERKACAEGFADDFEDVHAELNGNTMPIVRLQAPFSFSIPPGNNILGVKGSGVNRGEGYTDGYWVKLDSDLLPPGSYTLEFRGKCKDDSGLCGGYFQHVAYNLTVH